MHVSGVAHGSCILKDESQSGLNQQIVEKLKAGAWKKLSILGLDNVCDHGKEILAALRARKGF